MLALADVTIFGGVAATERMLAITRGRTTR